MIFAGTGHRPPRLNLGYDQASQDKLFRFAIEELKKLERDLEPDLTVPGSISIVSGMALGWDQALAKAALHLEWGVCAAPAFEGMESKWPKESQAVYNEILAASFMVQFVCPPGYSPRKFIERDHWMVDHCDKVIALWDGLKKGGTWATVDYAQKKRIPVVNVWEHYVPG